LLLIFGKIKYEIGSEISTPIPIQVNKADGGAYIAASPSNRISIRTPIISSHMYRIIRLT
jgi:hypothetical protein